MKHQRIPLVLATAALGVAALVALPAQAAHATMTGFKAVQGSNGWVDFNGDGRADNCYVDSIGPFCSFATASGFGGGAGLYGADSGWGAGRAWADFNGDGRADYCRVTGNGGNYLQCTVSNGSSFGAQFGSGYIDPGYDAGRAWVDVTGDGRADYCRITENWGYRITCTPSNGSGFGSTFSSGSIDPGYDQGRSWVDVNGDGRADYCRIVGSWGKSLLCSLSSGNGFNPSISSAELDPGYDDSRRWGDVNGDRKADYCRIVGSAIYASTTLRCTLSTGTGFGLTFTSPTLDAGYGGTGTWVDVTGDGRDDYCRVVGVYQGACTESTGSGFGTYFATPITSTDRLGWADFNNDGKADLCRWEYGASRCTVSNGTSFGLTYG